jgi:diaminohydroxyphosphoribosylaminopyrimidine deaminase / 5-amino-6-(5-phosphoribosylamino)uracil reductase
MNASHPAIAYLKETLQLAKKGLGWTSPNPMVGALLVKEGKIIGKGYHKKVGFPHAEVEAFNNATEDVTGATLYVNLEPCSTSGKQPPCTDTIIKKGISKVVFCTEDPNPQNHGKGIKALLNAGISIHFGLVDTEAKKLNEAFFTFHEKKRPFIAIKFAASLDGKIATKTHDSQWITNEKARQYARDLRGEYQAILVGINTVLHDNPHLGTRTKNKRDPLRIILDSKLQIPLKSQVLRDNNVLIATTEKADKEKKKVLEKKRIDIITCNEEQISLPFLLKELHKRNVISILVEGGSQVIGSFVDERFVDKVYAFHAPIIIGGTNAISAVGGNGVEKVAEAMRLHEVSFQQFGENRVTIGYPNY